MSGKIFCRYCGCRTTNLSGMCNQCTEKLMLIRKIRAIVSAIKRDAERERMEKHGQSGDNKDAQTVQRAAS